MSDPFQLLAALTTLAALFAWLNHRFLGLPRTIGLLVLGLSFSLALLGLERSGLAVADEFFVRLRALDFSEVLLGGMLGALLFAGALHIELERLLERWASILLLATVGVGISTLLVGLLAGAIFALLDLPIPRTYCFLFAALISPTDPIAVLSILRSAPVPESLEIQIAGESLFNDGVGIVLFLALLGIATGREPVERPGRSRWWWPGSCSGIEAAPSRCRSAPASGSTSSGSWWTSS
jgi:CPA1 family monovalent cation:H+ antiporter